MNARTRNLVIAIAVMIAAGVAVWSVVDRRDERAEPDVASDTASSDAEAERLRTELDELRAEIETDRVAGLVRAGEADDEPTPRLVAGAAGSDTTFSHARHRDVQCLTCHSTSDAHGAVTVASPGECMACHHSPPVSNDCTSCHPVADFQGERRRRTETFALSVDAAVTRDLVFAHVQHSDVQCTDCHNEGVSRAAAAACTDCHEQHHRPEALCMQCHTAPPRASHTVAAHVGCAGAGCHDPSPIQGVPRTRTLCLVCHQELVDHERGRNCADCHALPPPRVGSGV
ncbi:MAG: cytochrome c3 family protein [Gemmatimonadota bacterium]